MLRGAVQKHEQETVRAQRGAQEFFKSSPPEMASQQRTAPHPGNRSPLKPASASVVNGRGSGMGMFAPRSSTGGVKRMASGLAKLDGTWEDGPGSSAHQPITIGASTEQVSFDENDFDSDIDLDVEEPRPAPEPTKLPQQKSMAAPPKPAQYPSLDRDATIGSVDSGYSSNAPHKKASPQMSPPKSSAELPWSSSPTEHFEPTQSVASIRQFAYGGPTTQARQNGASQPTAAKRRKLPWQDEQESTQAAVPTTQPTKQRRNVESTPVSKESKKSTFPWNTTASAVKEQQKKFKEENRKAIKKNEGTEESLSKAKSTKSKIARVFLSEEQQHVLALVTEDKRSVFFTGSAGTGKSVLLREIIAGLRKKYQREPDRVAVTASTGLAACNIGGVTLHSFAGIGLGKEEVPELVKKIKKNQKAKHRWMRTKVLVIDEVSMVDAELFDKLEAIARQLRNNGRPFGGIQLVITGDFFQLPPVPEGSGRVARFAFDAATWKTTVEHTICLHHVFRQKDPVFAGMLNEMREGRLSQSSIDSFRNLSRPMSFDDSLEATELFPTRNEVERANSERLSMLQGTSEIFEARDGGAIVDKMQRDRLLQNCMAPEIITLKKGAQVMLIKNIDETLVNGSIGRVIGFMDETAFDRYHNNEEETFGQSQGGTIPNASDPGLNEGQKAMVHSINGGGITTSRKFPVVRFVIADGSSRDLLCQPESWKIELPNGEVQASRSQIPLILAWALSIHKAQGQTLDRVKVDLGKVFEKGQAYVALSRATSIAGLQVLRFDPKKVVAHDRVRNFYSNLSRVELAQKNSDRMGKNNKNGVKAEDYERMFVGDEMP
ncbi:hypothetical protein NU195Hw_g6726t1 [Hortaea werneckii]